MAFSWFQSVFFFFLLFFWKKNLCDNPEFSQLPTKGIEFRIDGPMLEWNSKNEQSSTQIHAALNTIIARDWSHHEQLQLAKTKV